ncbi:MAG: maltose ABC transporter substrate-binding protein [Turicibacter sp.]
MKKLITSICIYTLVSIGLVGCNETEKKADMSSKTTPEIKIWIDNEDYANLLMPALKKEFKDINFTYEYLGVHESISKLELDGPAGIAADIFLQVHDTMPDSINANLLLPLGTDLGTYIEDNMLENTISGVQKDGVYYGIPMSIDSMGFFYNKTLLEENGFEVAKTFDELIEQAKIYNNNSENKYLFRFEAGNSYSSHFFFTGHGYQLFGENHDNPEAINFNTPEVIEALKFIKSMKEYLPVPYGDLGYDTIDAEFIKGNVPYITTGPWSISDIKNGAEFEWGITTVPMINGVQPNTFSGFHVASINAYTKYPNEARDVLKFIASEDGLQMRFDTTGQIPALQDNSIIEGVLEDPYVAGIVAQSAYSDPIPAIKEMAYYFGACDTMIRSVWEDLATPEKAVEKAEEEYFMTVNMMK